MANDVASFVFEQVLRIDPSTISNYSTMQDQLLYLILIPHIVLFLFIVAFSRGIVTRVVGQHRGFEYLFGIAAYFVIVLGGWYGSILVPILLTWFYIAIGIALIIFIISIVFSPARAPALFRLGTEVGKTIGEKTTGKTKKREAIVKEIDILKAERNAIQDRLNDSRKSGTATKEFLAYSQMNLQDFDRRIARLQKEMEEL